jgi:hypothetical protein
MGVKAEVGWTTETADGTKRHVTAEKFGKAWKFSERLKRRGPTIQWVEIPEPALTDWLDLIEALERRYQRDLTPPDQLQHVRRIVRERFPEHRFA